MNLGQLLYCLGIQLPIIMLICTVKPVICDISKFFTKSDMKGVTSNNTGIFIMYSVTYVSAKGYGIIRLLYMMGSTVSSV